MHAQNPCALLDPKTYILTQKRHPIRNLNSETLRDSKNAFLHWGDVSVPLGVSPNRLPIMLQACYQSSVCNASLACKPVGQWLKAGGSCFGVDLACVCVIIVMHCLQPL